MPTSKPAAAASLSSAHLLLLVIHFIFSVQWGRGGLTWAWAAASQRHALLTEQSAWRAASLTSASRQLRLHKKWNVFCSEGLLLLGGWGLRKRWTEARIWESAQPAELSWKWEELRLEARLEDNKSRRGGQLAGRGSWPSISSVQSKDRTETQRENVN